MPRLFGVWWVQEMEQGSRSSKGLQEKCGKKIFGELRKPEEEIMRVDFFLCKRGK